MFFIRRFDYIIPKELDGVTVENYLMHTHGFSRRLITRLKREPEHIQKNGQHVRMVDLLATGDVLTILLAEDGSQISANSELQVPIIYEDDDLIVFHKPQSMPVHPSIAHHNDTLANFFMYHMNTQDKTLVFRPINRLDSDTVGLCLVAKNALSAKLLSHSIEKEYTALVCGNLPNDSGTINAPIARESDTIIKRIVSPDGQASITHYEVIERFSHYTLVRVRLETGRTHQIRVHFAHLGFPLAGDWLYGGDLTLFHKHMLCCNQLILMHPITKTMHKLCINIHEEWGNILNKLYTHSN